MTAPRLVKQINPGIRESRNDGSGSQGQFAELRRQLFFMVSDGLNAPIELWRSDGSEEGTYRMASDIKRFHVFEDTLYFNTDQGLLASNGTGEGSGLLTPTPRDEELYIDSFVRVGYTVFAVSRRGLPYYGIWLIDKSNEKINLQTQRAVDSDVVPYGNSFYFAGRDNLFGPNVNIELWKSDGTEVGTAQVADIFPGNRT